MVEIQLGPMWEQLLLEEEIVQQRKRLDQEQILPPLQDLEQVPLRLQDLEQLLLQQNREQTRQQRLNLECNRLELKREQILLQQHQEQEAILILHQDLHLIEVALCQDLHQAEVVLLVVEVHLVVAVEDKLKIEKSLTS